MTSAEALESIRDRFGGAEVECLLQRFGATDGRKLGDTGPLVEFAQACLNWNEPPSASWGDGVPWRIQHAIIG